MPTIRITEKDYTTPGSGEYTNFSVVIPGFYKTVIDTETAKPIVPAVFDDNGIYEVSEPDKFIKNIGGVAPKEISVDITSSEGSQATNETVSLISYGNQIAYELLSLGYTVLYLNLGSDTTYENVSALLDGTLLKALTDKANYDFRYITSGIIFKGATGTGSKNAALANKLVDIAAGAEVSGSTGRGDCIALIDIDETSYLPNETTIKTQADIIKAIKEDTIKLNLGKDASKYAMCIAPTLCFENLASFDEKDYKETETSTVNNKLPGTFYYLACAAHAIKDLGFAEWYATAGYTRGVSSLRVSSTSVKLGEAAINELEPRKAVIITKDPKAPKVTFTTAVNVIANFRNQYILWGNRTAYTLDENLVASHFLNIRQLCCSIKKIIYQACRRFTFDPNSDVLWINFCNAIRPTLEEMKADQGIEDYEIIKVATTEKATLKARVRIVPIEAVEDFDIEISLEDSLGDTRVAVSE